MDSLARLTSALSDRYTLDRELGRGGMAVVYLARDRKLDRPVALKVLRPELAASLGADRFLREIQIASKLSHPNILGLHDCGEADGLLYYTMPYVEGETLRERMNREKQLPLEDALQITREVAGALGHAHEQGLVHRDVKPENILFQGGHAVVADFGIARALTEAGGTNLTETGLAVGTPAYMSPEQAAGSGDVDGRADLYSLGCVLYEMLSGDAPYMASTPQAILAKKLTDPLPSITTVRQAVPAPVAAALAKSLARNAADRFKTAEQFAAALSVDTVEFERSQRATRRMRKMVFATAALAVLAAASIGISKSWAASDWKRAELDPELVAVMPFRVTATDPDVRSMDEGLQDLLFGMLGADIGLRAVDIGLLKDRWNAWRDDGREAGIEGSVRLAASLGAGMVMDGAVTQAGGLVVVSGTLREVPTGAELAQFTDEVPTDSVLQIPRRLVQGLLGDRLGEGQERLGIFERHPHEAVMEYLAGARAFRTLDPVTALRHFDAALTADSTFALAALRMALVYFLPTEGEEQGYWRRGTAIRAAQAHRESLGNRDRAALDYLRVIERIDTTSNFSEIVPLARAWAEAAPDDPRAQLEYGWSLLGGGTVLSIPGWNEERRRVLQRAWVADSTTPYLVVDHLVQSVRAGDRDWIRRIAPQYLALAEKANPDSIPDSWLLAFALGDSTRVRELRSRAMDGDPLVATVPVGRRLMGGVWGLDFPLSDLDLVSSRAQARAVTAADSAQVVISWVEGSHVKGRFRETIKGFEQLASYQDVVPWTVLIDWSLTYPQFDSVAGIAATSLRQYLSTNAGDVRSNTITEVDNARCMVELYRAAHGDTVGVREEMRRLEPRIIAADFLGVCPSLIGALFEAQDPETAEAPALEHLASLLRRGTWVEYPAPAAMVTVARLYRERGEYEKALEAARLRIPTDIHYQYYVGLLREEGDLSVILGDTASAVEAYREILRLWYAPDDLGQPFADSIRATLTALERDWSGGN